MGALSRKMVLLVTHQVDFLTCEFGVGDLFTHSLSLHILSLSPFMGIHFVGCELGVRDLFAHLSISPHPIIERERE